MSWEDDLREAAYTPPSGQRLTFTFESVSEEFDQKGDAFNFADADGTYPQPLGATGRRYPLRVFLWGENYNREAEAFMNALQERGEGVLEHPAYGRKQVVPVGTVRRRDDLVRQAGQATIEVTFFETSGAVYPTANEDPFATQAQLIEEANAANADQLAAAFDDFSAADEQTFLGSYNASRAQATADLSSVTSGVQGASRYTNRIETSITKGIQTLIGDPVALALQTSALVQSASRFPTQTLVKLNSYKASIDRILGRDTSTSTPATLSNQDLYAVATAVATAQSVSTTRFSNRGEALVAAETMLELLDELPAWRDAAYDSAGVSDNGGVWQSTQELLAYTAGLAVSVSFGLAQQRSIVTASERSIIDLCFELYGDIDDKLDALINDNNLSGDEIIEIPRGREIVYYV